MSLGHISLLRMPADEDRIVYEVRSCDFAAVPGEQALIGYLSIEPVASKYAFSTAGEFAGQLVPPVELFELEEAEVFRKLRTEYPGHTGVLWVRAVSRVARWFIEQGTYPERYPWQS